MLPEIVIKQNEVKRKFGRKMRADMLGRLRGSIKNGSGESASKFRFKHVLQYGEIDKTQIKTTKQAIMLEHGASRGYGGSKGSKWMSPSQTMMTTNPSSKGKMGTGERPAYPWWTPAVERHLPKLANALAQTGADVAAQHANVVPKASNFRIDL